MQHVTAITLEEQRHKAQLAFVAGGAELEVGSSRACPLPLEQLLATRGNEPYVIETHSGGLTAFVYRLRVDGRDWTLKLARKESLVRNIDGQTSFLNEVQRRADFETLKAQPGGRQRFAAIVDTTYASFRRGVMVSPWIEGEIVRTWDERRIAQLIAAACECASAGLFEWDLSPGNILDDGRQIRLFDFGYMYRFGPLRQFNSAGVGDDLPLFHPVERFETRNFFGVLLTMERERGAAAALAAFRLEKEIAIEAYRKLRADLAARGATVTVLDWFDGMIARWSKALDADLDALYLTEGWRSHVLDLDDDLRGQTCTPMTLARADWLIDALLRHHPALMANDAFFWHDIGRARDPLLLDYRGRRARAEKFQIASRR